MNIFSWNKLSLLRKGIAVLITLGSVFFFLRIAILNFRNIPDFNWNLTLVAMFAISIIFVTLSTFVRGINWFILLGHNGVSISLIQAESIFLISQFGKYIPGNVGQYVGRILWAKGKGIPVPISVNTLLVETLWDAGIGGSLGLFSLMLFIDKDQVSGNLLPWHVIIFVPFLLIVPWVGTIIINRFFPWFAKWLSKDSKIPVPGPVTAIMVSIVSLSSFFLMGMTLNFLANSFFHVQEVSFFQVTCLFSIAWVTGFVTPGAPGGMGIREAMIVILFSPLFGTGTAVGLGVVLRVTTILGDALAFIVGLLGKRFLNNKSRL